MTAPASPSTKTRGGASSLALFLQDLTGLRAFFLFALSLLFSVGAAVALGSDGIYAFVVPSAPVLAYSALLVLAQRRMYVHLNGTLRDSPYFLGFMVTMAELVLVFASIARQMPPGRQLADIGNALDVGSFIRSAGAAVVPTVVGLFSRQALHSLDTSEEAVDRVWESLAREVRQRTFELHQAQSQFVKLLNEFNSSREELFAREETASRRYVENLEVSARSLASLPDQASVIDGHLKNVTESLKAIAESLAARRDAAAHQLDLALRQLGEQFLQTTNTLRESLSTSIQAVTSQTQRLQSTLQTAGDLVTRQAQGLESVVNRFAPSAESIARAFEAVAKQADSAKASLAAAIDELNRSGKLLGQTAVNMDQANTQTQQNVAKQLDALSKDLQAIDSVVSQVVTHISRHLATFGKPA